MKSFNTFLIERRKTKRDIPNNSEHELIHDDGSAQLYKLTSHKASKEIYGGGSHKGYPKTDWCTASQSCANFNEYNKENPLYVIHSKDDRGNPQVHQFHEKSFKGGYDFMNAEDKEDDFLETVKKHPDLINKIKFTTKENEEEFNQKSHSEAIDKIKSQSKTNTSFLDNLSSNDNDHLITSAHLSQEHKDMILAAHHSAATNRLIQSAALNDNDAGKIIDNYKDDSPEMRHHIMNNLLANNNISKSMHSTIFNNFLDNAKKHNLGKTIYTNRLAESKHLSDDHINELLKIPEINNNIHKASELASGDISSNTISSFIDRYKNHPNNDIPYEKIINNKNVTTDHLKSIIDNEPTGFIIKKAKAKLNLLGGQ